MWPLNLKYETSYIPSWNSIEEYYAELLALFHIYMAKASNIFFCFIYLLTKMF